ncbi:MAG: TRAP transporter small permease subunit [Deltaproteobacteria bacterium]|nr:TRAP transporter small permease subunit [Deltaproteobacteria bacterium]
MYKLVRIISALNLTVGWLAAPLSLVITALVLMEVLARYLLNAPTSWSNETNQYLLCALVMFGGGFTLRRYGHTRVDIFIQRFTDRTCAWVEVVAGVMVLIFTCPMLYYGALLSGEAFLAGQTSVSAAELPLWPSMATVPLGALFLLLQALANTLVAVHFIQTGEKWEAV